MIMNAVGEFFIAGTNSGGSCCNFGSDDEYKRLADNLDWITSVIRNDGGRFNTVT